MVEIQAMTLIKTGSVAHFMSN